MFDFALELATAAAAGGAAAGLCGPVYAALTDTSWGAGQALTAEMTAAGMNPAPLPVYLLVFRGSAAAAVGLVWGVVGMAPVAGVLAAAAVLSGPWFVRGRISAYRRAVNSQVAGVARSLGGQVRAGRPLCDALATVSAEAPAPLGLHLRQTSRRIAQGEDARTAIGRLRDGVRVEAVTTLAVAVLVAEERGGRLADVLDRVAHSADERSRIERKREADTAAGRLMVTLMGAFPVAFLGILHGVDPELLLGLVREPAGHWVLAATAAIVYASVRWASWILGRAS